MDEENFDNEEEKYINFESFILNIILSHYNKSIDNATYYMLLIQVFKDNYKFLVNMKYLNLLVFNLLFFYFI